jgi:hypothetical protein
MFLKHRMLLKRILVVKAVPQPEYPCTLLLCSVSTSRIWAILGTNKRTHAQLQKKDLKEEEVKVSF